MPEPTLQYGSIDRCHGRVVEDPDWECPADIMRAAHGHTAYHGHGPVEIAYRWAGPAGDVGPWIDLATHQIVTTTPKETPA